MTAITADIRTFTLNDATFTTLVGGRVHVNKVPERSNSDFLYLATESAQEDDVLNGSVGAEPLSWTVAFEAVSFASQSAAQAIKDRLRAILNNFRGTLGSRTAKAVFLSELPEDYIPRNQGGDDGAYVTTGQLQVFV